jgi:taurine---2-oxoglutarate transaminase
MNRTIKTFIPWMKQTALIQEQISHASNSYIFNQSKKILDFTSGAMVVNLGHNNKYIIDGIQQHLKTGISYVPSNFSTYQRDLLSERIIDASNYENNTYSKVLYTNAGADANESAIYLTREYFNLNKIENKFRTLSFSKSFHGGSTIGASNISGDARCDIKKEFYQMPLEPIMENPKLEDHGDSSLFQIESLLKSCDVASILVEGSSGSAGCILYPTGYLYKLKTLCEKYNTLMICDEVMSGWFRTGKLFAHHKQNIEPDIITTAKAITSGYAQLGAVIVNHKIADMFEDNPVMVGLTYSGHVLPCTIANRCLDLYLNPKLDFSSEVENKSKYINDKAHLLVNRYDFINQYRNNGMLGCFEFKLQSDQELAELSGLILKYGVYCMRIRKNIFIAPPLTIDYPDILDGFDNLNLAFHEYSKL